MSYAAFVVLDFVAADFDLFVVHFRFSRLGFVLASPITLAALTTHRNDSQQQRNPNDEMTACTTLLHAAHLQHNKNRIDEIARFLENSNLRTTFLSLRFVFCFRHSLLGMS